MRRRDFVFLLGVVVVAAPVRVRAETAPPLIGFIHIGAAAQLQALVAGFRDGLAQTGFVEGENVTVEYRWAEGRPDRLPAMAADLVGRGASVIVGGGGPAASRAAKAATATTPILFIVGSDPVKDGLVTSFSRPGGNLTGVTLVTSVLPAKQFELLRALVPDATTFAVLVNPNNAENSEQIRQSVREFSGQFKCQVHALGASTPAAIDAAFAALPRLGAGALLVTSDPFFQVCRDQLVALAARDAVPILYYERIFPAAGGLMSYGPNIGDMYRPVGVYAGRILRGAKPADLPVVQPTEFELVANLKTAATLGLTIPPMLLALADEVIE